MHNDPADLEKIRELTIKYGLYTDCGNIEKYVGLFTDDCDWDGGIFGRCLGRAALLEMLQANASAAIGMRHHMSNLLVRIEGDEAFATSYVHVFDFAQQPVSTLFVGIYFDHLVKQGGEWFFKVRKIRQDFADAVGPWNQFIS